MKRITIILGVLAAIAAASCNKESPERSAGADGLCSVTINIGMESPIVFTTKADSYNAAEEDDFIDRLDMFEYDKDGILIGRKTWKDASGLDLSSIRYKVYSSKNVYKTFVFLANFDEESMDYFGSLSGTDIGSNTKAVLPLEAGNFRMHRPLMGGAVRYDFRWDGKVEVALYRYMTKFEIGTVTADFIDRSYLGGDVKLKKIAIIHAPNFIRPVQKTAQRISFGSDSVLGAGYSYPSGGKSPSIGNLEHFSTAVNRDVSNGSAEGEFNLTSYGASGKLAGDFPYAYNYNMGAAKGVLITDAPGDMYTATVHEFGPLEGILCKSDDEGWPHSCAVNRVFYTFPWYRNAYGYLWGDHDSQDDTQKMVFQIEIDGTDYFYIIPMRELEANMVYRLSNISIKGLGSEYCNFYPRRYAGEINPISVAGWTETEIDDMNVGYKDDLGLEIY